MVTEAADSAEMSGLRVRPSTSSGMASTARPSPSSDTACPDRNTREGQLIPSWWRRISPSAARLEHLPEADDRARAGCHDLRGELPGRRVAPGLLFRRRGVQRTLLVGDDQLDKGTVERGAGQP